MKTIFYIAILLFLMAGCKKEEPVSKNTWVSNKNIIFNPNLTYGTVIDIDGNVYKTIQIGTQTWMAENLKTTKYRNGDPIPNIISEVARAALTTGAYCWYNNDSATYKANYGALYNWYAVADSRKIAPIGWHVPTDYEWTKLTTYLGIHAGGQLKEIGTIHWISPNPNTNESGFTALPGGGYGSDGGCGDIGDWGFWWSSTEFSTADALDRQLAGGMYSGIGGIGNSKVDGNSVRCVKD